MPHFGLRNEASSLLNTIEIFKRTYDRIHLNLSISRRLVMKISIVVVLLTAMSSLVQAAQAPDSGASGDQRRILTAGLREMQGVDMTKAVGHGGSYGGLYNVECKYAGSRAMVCTGSDKPEVAVNRWNSDAGAVLVGSVLKENVDGAQNAFVIRAKVVGCNSVGDECYILGVSYENAPPKQ